MKTTALILALLCFPLCCNAQLGPVYEKPGTKTDFVWQLSKISGLMAAEADAITTASALRQGCFETNPGFNILIPKTSPAPMGRSALMLGQAYVANWVLASVYRRCNSKLCRWAVIGIRTALTAESTACAVHNAGLP